MSAAELIDQVHRAGGQLWVDGASLRFRAPKGALGADLKARLAAAKADVIAELTRETTVLRAPEERFEPFPLTEVQAAYSVGRTAAFRWGGVGCHGYAEFAVDHAVARPGAAQYRSAWRKVVDAHDMLRCVVHPDGYQVIRCDLGDGLTVLESSDDRQIGDERARIAGELRERGYPLGVGPMYDIVVTIGPRDTVVHVSIDLLIADFVSITILMTDFGLCLLDAEYRPPEVDFSFRDYLLNLGRHRDSAVGSVRRQRDLAYWRGRLDRLPPPITLPLLPCDDAPATDTTPRFSRRSMRLPPERFAELNREATRCGATASAVITAVFTTVLGRYGDRDHFLLTLTTMTRHPFTPDVGRLVGDFTGTSLLDVDVGGQRPFVELLRLIGACLFEDMDHAGVSGVDVARMLARSAENRGEHSPVVLTSTLGADPRQLSADVAFLRPIPGAGCSQTPQVLLDCQVFEIGGACEVNWDTRDEAISPEVLDRAFADFRSALQTLSTDPTAWDRPLLPAIAPEPTPVHDPPAGAAALIHSGFLRRAADTPDAVAIRRGEWSATYCELLAAARSVAAVLAAAGVGTGDYVGIRLPDGPKQVAALLGAALAGAAYVPLDVAWPDRRVAQIIEQCAPALLCEPGGPVDELLADPATWLPGTAAEQPDIRCGPDDTAYVIFTSGSTGTPKGVMVSHRAVTNTVNDINDRLAVGAGDSVLAVSQHTFDLSVYNIFGLLAAGGALVFPDTTSRNDPRAWWQALTRHRVSVWNSVPAQMQLLLDQAAHAGDRQTPATLPSLRQIMLSGDWIPVSQPPQIAALAPGASMLSLGGATEAAIWSICHPLAARRYPRSVPYGTAMRNQSVRVLTHRGEPAAPWQVGEIHIGGLGLAQGYLGDPARTAAAFIEHPVSGERLYRTGDYGRLTDGGVIELLGRTDNQVKIAGHRIELAEVDSGLSDLPGVRAAASTVVGRSTHDRVLAAAVVPDAAADDEQSERRAGVAAAGRAMDETHRHFTADLAAEKLLRFATAADTVAVDSMCAALSTVAAPGELISADDLAHRLSLPERLHRLFRRWLDVLVDEGRLRRHPESRLEVIGHHELSDCAERWQRVRQLGAAIDYGDALLAYVGECIPNLPGLLAGRVDPLGLFFPQGSVETATAAYRDNLLSRYTNRLVIAGVTARAAGSATPQRPLRVLEVGAGVGGTSVGLVAALAGYDAHYTFTDVSTFFLTLAAETFADHDFVDYRLFDINSPPAQQGFAPCSFDVVVCANVLHNAVNIDDTLAVLNRLLVPGGSLVIVDATAVNHPLMISMEFKEGLHGFTDARAGTNAAFLSHPQWDEALARSPLGAVRSFPPPGHQLGRLGQHVFWCDSASTARALRPAELTEQARRVLPDYLVPQQLVCLPALPLTTNGKIDRAAVTAELESLRAAARAGGPDIGGRCGGLDAMQSAIAEIWAATLGLDPSQSLSPASDFFALGGDSLLMTQAIGRIRREIAEAAELAWDDLLRAMVANPTLAAAAAAVRRPASQSAPRESDRGAEPVSSSLVYLGAGAGFTRGAEIAVCVHDGSGGLAPYDQLVDRLRAAADRVPELYGLRRIPGDGYLRTPPAELFTTLAARYAVPIVALAPTRVHLLGYCMGGLLAAEIAKYLEEAGVVVGSVTVVSSYRVPIDVADDDILDYCFAQIMGVAPEALGLRVDDAAVRAAFTLATTRYGEVIPAGALRGAADPALTACLQRSAEAGRPRLKLLAESGALGGSWDVESLTELRSTFVHSLRAVTRAAAEPFLGDIHFLRQRGDIHFLPTLQEDMTAFWADYCLGELTITDINGNHFNCLTGENAKSVAELLADAWAGQR